MLAGMPWFDLHCPGCGTSRAIDLRTSIGTRCLSRHAGARPAVLMVSRVSADGEAIRLVRDAAGPASAHRMKKKAPAS
jgi:hypothetical protein